MDKRLEFPTTDQIEKATHEGLARWYRFLLPSGKEQQAILDRIADRFRPTFAHTGRTWGTQFKI